MYSDVRAIVFKINSLGYIFAVTDENGKTTKYKITDIQIVKVGAYKKSWFYLSGARRLVMITCHGKIVKKHYTENQIFFASPVK